MDRRRRGSEQRLQFLTPPLKRFGSQIPIPFESRSKKTTDAGICCDNIFTRDAAG